MERILESELIRHLEKEGFYEIIEKPKNEITLQYAKEKGYSRYVLKGKGNLQDTVIFY